MQKTKKKPKLPVRVRCLGGRKLGTQETMTKPGETGDEAGTPEKRYVFFIEAETALLPAKRRQHRTYQ